MLMWADNAPEMQILINTLESEGHEIVYWVGMHGGEYMCPQGAIFHDHFDAWAAKPAQAWASLRIPAPSAPLIRSMVAAESVVLPMMNKRYDKAPVDERQQIYYDMLGYWDFAIKELKPDAIILGTIPHSIYTYVIHDLAKKYGVPTWCFDPIWIGYRFIWFSDFWHGSDELRRRIQYWLLKGVSPQDLGPEVRAYWEEHVGESARKEPVYMTTDRQLGSGWGLFRRRVLIAWRALFDGRFFRLALAFVSRMSGPNLRKEYARVVQNVEWNVPFVYFPLHYQPELSTLPLGGVYHQQILVAETIAAALPDGWELYVKEHPAQWWTRMRERYSSVRYPGYYERLARIPGVRIIPFDTNTFELIDRARAVATVTGTAGWESLLRGKCPLVFGVSWYRDCPGVFKVDSVDACADALKKIEGGAVAPPSGLLAFLKAYEENSHRSSDKSFKQEKPLLTPEENVRVLAEYICSRLLKK